MSNNLSRPDRIDAGGLKRGDYLVSLLEQALIVGLIKEDTVDDIKIQCIKLLGEISEHYTSGESSSIPESVADMLLKSVLYTVGIALKSYPSADIALSVLLDKGVAQVYADGRVRISEMLRESKADYSKLCSGLLPVGNRTYNETILQGIKGFFKIYDPSYASHETIITADYPTARDLTGLSGIEFIAEFVRCLDAENNFLRRFDTEHVHALFGCMDKDWSELVINIFLPVLCQAVGCALAGRNPASLYLDEGDISALKDMLSGKSREEILKSVTEVYDLRISHPERDARYGGYVRSTLPAVASEILYAVRNRTIQRAFVAVHLNARVEKTIYSFGTRMDDEKYRALLDKIFSLSGWTEKLSLITHTVKSLADYDDLLVDAELSGEDTYRVLRFLHAQDIAALCVRYFVFDEAGYEFNDREGQSRAMLEDYLQRVSETDREAIKQIAKNMEIR
ncbi:MAG: DUF6179 domain-containing protein [Eubacteriales bacterium]